MIARTSRILECLALAALAGLVIGTVLAFFIVSSAAAFVIGRWCAKLLGWY